MTDDTLDTSASDDQNTDDQNTDDLGTTQNVDKTDDKTEDKTVDKDEPKVDAEGYWPDDWREQYAGDDEKLAKRLSRYASPKAAIDAMIAAQNKISSGKMRTVLDKDSTPEEIKEYRESLGIPDTPKGYSLDLSEGLVVGDNDKELLGGFLETAHERNYTQEQVTSALEWYYDEQDRMQQERYNADVAFKSAAEDELRQEFGQEYTPNRHLMANYLSTDFGAGVGELIAGARLADGTMLANHPDVIRGFVAKARISNPMGALTPGSGTKQMDSIIDEIAAIEKRMGDSDWYGDKKAQDRYLKLVAARDNVKAR